MLSADGMPILLIFVAVVVLAFAGFHLARFLRGSIKLTLPRTTFTAGEGIAGSLDLHVKRPLRARQLVVNLIGVEVSRRRSGGRSRSHSREFFRETVVVEEGREYPAGHQAELAFEVPTTALVREADDSTAGKLVQGAMLLLGSRRHQKWRVEARLEASGPDLVASRSVRINLG